ncbi:hypothetical protein CPC16_002798 [Podila verticillata]|nr:hypothetical protein CPC16_002798 [Podila verticillata]
MAAKDDAVFVDMASSSHEHHHEEEEDIPPYQENDAYKPLLGDTKVDDLPEYLSKEDPEAKGAPLPDANPCATRRRCFVERLRARFGRRQCSDEQREKRRAKARKFRKFFRIFFGLLFVTWLFGGFECDERENDGWIMVDNEAPSLLDYSDMKALATYDEFFNSDCEDLVPWRKTVIVDAETRHLNIGFGKGNMVSDLAIRTGDVDSPVLFLRANVTQTRRRHDDGDDDGDFEHEGIHVDLSETEDTLDIQIWADKYVQDDDNDNDDDDNDDDDNDDDEEPPRRKPKHHKKHKKHHKKHHGKKHHKRGEHHDDDNLTPWKRQLWAYAPMDLEYQPESTKKFCAVIEAELVLPANFETYGRLTIGGLVLNIRTDHSLHHIKFEELALRSVVGEVNAASVSADVFRANTVVNAIYVDSVHTATHGIPLDVEIGSVLGNIHVHAHSSPVYLDLNEDDGDEDEDKDGDEDDDEDEAPNYPPHKVRASSRVGSVKVSSTSFKRKEDDEHDRNKVKPGILWVDAGSTAGSVEANIVLLNKQPSRIEVQSITNNAALRISDNFLGDVQVRSDLGKASIREADDSESQLDWVRKTNHQQHAIKYIKDKKTPVREEGTLYVFSGVNTAELEFHGHH